MANFEKLLGNKLHTSVTLSSSLLEQPIYRVANINLGQTYLTLIWLQPELEHITKQRSFLTRQKRYWLNHSSKQTRISRWNRTLKAMYYLSPVVATVKRCLHLQRMLNATDNATRYFSNMFSRIVHTNLRNTTATLNKTPFRILGMFSYLIKFVSRSTFYMNKRILCGHYGSLHEKKNIYSYIK